MYFLVLKTEYILSIVAILVIILSILISAIVIQKKVISATRDYFYLSGKYYTYSLMTKELFFVYDYLTDTIDFSKYYSILFGSPVRVKKFSREFENPNVNIFLNKEFFNVLINAKDGVVEVECQVNNPKTKRVVWYKLIVVTIFEGGNIPKQSIVKLIDFQSFIDSKDYDYLKGVYKRATVEAKIELLLEKSLTKCILVFDLDDLKGVNDKYGHMMGDKYIILLSDLLRRHLVGNFIFGRFGGDEFIAYGYDFKYSDISKIISTLNNEMQSQLTYEGKFIPTSVSVGGCYTRKNLTMKEMFEKADSALYKVKKSSKNSYYIDQV
jgi:diguanylate cyclase (GGDEF)-like protein